MQVGHDGGRLIAAVLLGWYWTDARRRRLIGAHAVSVLSNKDRYENPEAESHEGQEASEHQPVGAISLRGAALLQSVELRAARSLGRNVPNRESDGRGKRFHLRWAEDRTDEQQILAVLVNEIRVRGVPLHPLLNARDVTTADHLGRP